MRERLFILTGAVIVAVVVLGLIHFAQVAANGLCRMLGV